MYPKREGSGPKIREGGEEGGGEDEEEWRRRRRRGGGVEETRVCNIPGFGVTKMEETDVCIAFMHRKSGEFSFFKNKTVTVTKVSLDLGGIEVAHQVQCYKPQRDFVKTLF
jgi:hypothetical protein